jgi:hypothetical protein
VLLLFLSDGSIGDKKFSVMRGQQTNSKAQNEILHVPKGILFSPGVTGIMQHC